MRLFLLNISISFSIELIFLGCILFGRSTIIMVGYPITLKGVLSGGEMS
jgi:hypothetical protein